MMCHTWVCRCQNTLMAESTFVFLMLRTQTSQEKVLHNLLILTIVFCNKTQLYSGNTANATELERLSYLLYNRLLTFQIQIGIFEYSNEAVFSLSENFKSLYEGKGFICADYIVTQ